MVVVNDASHLVGNVGVEVMVLSTRPTNQGLMLFARLVVETGSNSDLGAGAESAGSRASS